MSMTSNIYYGVVYLLFVLRRIVVIGLLVVLCCVWERGPVACVAAQDDPPLGQKVYAQHCAVCHGDQAQGNPKYFTDPLVGDLPLGDLSDYIAGTMPEADPDLVVGEDAQAVAKYLYDQFYSPAAQRRRNKPRVELARMTVRQFRTSVADLVGRFDDAPWVPEDHGLLAFYFAASSWRENLRLAKQVDAKIDFPEMVPHFDAEFKFPQIKDRKAIKKLQLPSQGFSVYWIGSIIAPRTGEYQLTVKTRNGFRLFVNDSRTALLDRTVQSDESESHHCRIYLLAGRAFPMKLEFIAPGTSFKKTGPPRVELCWQPPGQPQTTIPSTALVPHQVPEVYVVDNDFPADDASAGYERGVDVSDQWDQATTQAAIQAAVWIARRINRLASFEKNESVEQATAKARSFCERFVQAAFSSRLSDEDIQFYVGQHFDRPLSIEDQVKRVVLITLKSPRFLFPGAEDRSPRFSLASRMAMTLWDSVPDTRLHKAAQTDRLDDPAGRRQTAAEMVADFRAKAKLTSFFEQWLDAHTEQATKDEQRFPGFDQSLVADLRISLTMYLDDVVWSEKSDYRQLFVADYWYVNRRMAEFYDLEFPGQDNQGFVKVTLDQKHRAGLLTHPYLLAGLAYDKDSSPIHRGVFVAKRMLGRRLRQPPDDVEPLPEDFAPDMTTRQRVELQTKSAVCMNCHSLINPLGFSLENFDAVGRFRERDNQQQIDPSSVYRAVDGKEIPLNGARDLANFLANDAHAQKAFIRQLFRYFAKQPVDAYGEDQIDRLHRRFVQHEFNIKELLTDMALVVAKPSLESGNSVVSKNTTKDIVAGHNDSEATIESKAGANK